MNNFCFLTHKIHYTHTHFDSLVYERNWIVKKMKNEWMNDDHSYEIERKQWKWNKGKEKSIHPLLGQKKQSLQFIDLVLKLTHLVTSLASNHR
jgi:protease II